MSAAESDYYDRVLNDPDALALLSGDESPWRPLYREAAALIEPWQPVIDLGCGTGRFAAVLAERGRDATYEGLDFSPEAIAAADSLGLADAHPIDFWVADLRDWAPPRELPGSTTFVCLETLEHLDDDRDLVARIPPGHRLILSVPNYYSEAHVRVFPSPKHVWDRYDHLLVFRRWVYIDFADGAPGRGIHLCETVRRAESWG